MYKIIIKRYCRKAIQLYHYFSELKNFVDEFENKDFYRDQVVFIAHNNHPESNFKILGALFGGTDGIITTQLSKNSEEKKWENWFATSSITCFKFNKRKNFFKNK